MPNNTEVRLVYVRMDDFLDKKLLEEYLHEVSMLKKKERLKQTIDEAKAKKIYAKTKERAMSRNSIEDDSEFKLRDAVYLPVHIERNLETVESYEKNKDNPEFYPKLDPGEAPKGGKIIDFPTEIITTRSKFVAARTEQIFQKERQEFHQGMKNLRPADYDMSAFQDEEPDEGCVIFTKAKPKKKKGK